jgi:hypothetical protein
MKKIIIALFLFFSLSLNAQVKKLGFYTNEVSKDGEHSTGYTLQLWKYNDMIIGQVSYNEGLIGDQISNFISNVQYDPESKSFSFQSKLGDSLLEFVGNIYKTEVLGAFKWNSIKATKRKSLKICCEDAEINIDYKSFEDWKQMWKQFEN